MYWGADGLISSQAQFPSVRQIPFSDAAPGGMRGKSNFGHLEPLNLNGRTLPQERTVSGREKLGQHRLKPGDFSQE